MISFALAVAIKDLRLICRNSGIIIQAILLGLAIIFIFSLAGETGKVFSPREAGAIFWIGSIFCQILLFNQLYAFEEINQNRIGLLLTGSPVQGIWLGKATASFAGLAFVQLCLLPAITVFLNQTLSADIIEMLAAILVCNAGSCATGSLLGAISTGQGSRDSLLAILLFPLLVPLLLGGISLVAKGFGAEEINSGLWWSLIFAFDAIFTGTGLILFAFLYRSAE